MADQESTNGLNASRMIEGSKNVETGKFVYLSGDLFNEDCRINFTLAQNFLEDLGYVVINPIQLKKIADSLAQEQIMQIRYRLVEMTNIIFMVSGWQRSKSANAELSYAKSLGKKVMYQDYYAPFRKVNEYEKSSEEII